MGHIVKRATFASVLLAVLCSPLIAGVYDGWVASPDGHYAIRNLSGKMVIAASTATYSTATITLDGTTGNITAGKYYGDGSSLSGISASASLVGVRYSTDPVSTSLIDLSTVTAAIANASPNLTGVRYSTDPVSVGLIDLSTVTASLSGKLSNTATIPAGLVNLSTVTTALAAKADVASVVPSSATGYYGLYVASAAYAANGFTPGTSILNNGSYGLTTSSDVVAHAYYGDGSHLTGITGGGVQVATAALDGLPIGTFINYGSTTAPAGYLYCNGVNYSTTTYADLFGVIGYKYSGFAVSSGPVFTCDFRGMFSRGVDEAKLRDSEFRVIGSTEADKMQGHSHEFWALQDATAATGAGTAAARGGVNATQKMVDNSYVKNTISDGTNGTPRTSVETRPKNIAVAVMVKYANVASVNISSTIITNGQANTWTGSNTFTGSVTVSSLTIPSGGMADLGVWISSQAMSANVARAACPSGLRAYSGSCIAVKGTAYQLSGALTTENTSSNSVFGTIGIGATTTYSYSCSASENGGAAYAYCARIK